VWCLVVGFSPSAFEVQFGRSVNAKSFAIFIGRRNTIAEEKGREVKRGEGGFNIVLSLRVSLYHQVRSCFFFFICFLSLNFLL